MTPRTEAVAADLAPALAAVPLIDEHVALDTSRGSERALLLSRLLCFTDAASALAAGALAALAVGASGTASWLFVLLAAATWCAVVFGAGLLQVDTLGEWASGLPQLGRMAGAALVVSWPYAGLAALLALPHPIVAALATAGASLGLTLGGRTVARGLVHRVELLRQRTLILGSGVVAARLADRLRRHRELGLEPIGIVDDEVLSVEGADLPVLGRLSELRDVLSRHGVDRVIIAFSRAGHEELLEAMRACREERVAVDVVPRLFEFLEGARAIERIGGLPVLSIGAHRLSRASAIAKRTLDVVLSLAALVVLAPLLALIAVAVKLDSRGPVLFRQPRAGRGGEPFGLIKFRSMHPDADERKLAVADRNDLDDGIMFKIRRDPRVTRVGRLLRRTSLDELPQLVNVLRGEMSLVGPRPLILSESEALGGSWHARRLDLRPGLTGPWQVSGRSDLSVHDMVRLDFQYVTGWSLARDLELLLATVPVVLAGRGAY